MEPFYMTGSDVFRTRAIPTLTVLTAVCAWLLLNFGDARVGLDLAIGIFAVLLTVIALVITLSYDAASSWPSIRRLLFDPLVALWLLVASSSVFLLALEPEAVVLIPGPGPTTGEVGFGLAAVSLGFGLYLTGRLIHRSGGPSQERYLAGEIASSLRGERRRGDSRLQAFLQAVESAIERGDADSLAARVAELRATEPLVSNHASPEAIDMLLRLDLLVADRIGRAAIQGALDAPGVTRTLVPSLIRNVQEHSSLLSEDGLARADAQIQQTAALHLGRFAMLFAWWIEASLHVAAHAETTDVESRMAQIAVAARTAREHLISLIDPDPPNQHLEVHHPWHRGLSNPEAAMLFFYSFSERSTHGVGSALYALVETLTEEKFSGSFSTDRLCMWTVIMDRLDDPSASEAPRRERRTSARALLDELGGVPWVSLQCFVGLLASFPPHAPQLPEQLRHLPHFSLPPYRRAKYARWMTLRDKGRFATAEEAIDALHALVLDCSVGNGPTLASWARGFQQQPTHTLFGEWAAATQLPRPAPSERLGASTMAVLLRLVPLSAAENHSEAVRFIRWLPDRALIAALMLIRSWFTDHCAHRDAVESFSSLRSMPRAAQERQLLETSRFVQISEV